MRFFVHSRFVHTNPPINQNLKDKLVFVGVLAEHVVRLPPRGSWRRATEGECVYNEICRDFKLSQAPPPAYAGAPSRREPSDKCHFVCANP